MTIVETEYRQVGPIHDAHGAVRPLTPTEMGDAHTTGWEFASACYDARGNVITILLTKTTTYERG